MTLVNMIMKLSPEGDPLCVVVKMELVQAEARLLR